MFETIEEFYQRVKDDRDTLKEAWNAIGAEYTQAIARGASYNTRLYYKRLQDDLWYTFTVYDDECRRLEEEYNIC